MNTLVRRQPSHAPMLGPGLAIFILGVTSWHLYLGNHAVIGSQRGPFPVTQCVVSRHVTKLPPATMVLVRTRREPSFWVGRCADH